MTLERQKKLVNNLIEKTRSGALDWKLTIYDNSYQVSFSSSSVRIKEVEVEGRSNDYYIYLINSDGQTVDSFSDVQLQNEETQQVSWYTRMSDLFDAARRKALGSDRVLDDILSEMEG